MPSRRATTTTTTVLERSRGRACRADRRRRPVRCRAPAGPPAPSLQDPGGHQAPPDPADPGRQGGARQQGRGSHHLSVAGRPLLGPDAQHRQGRRHLAQDHRRRGPQAAEGHRGRTRGARGHGRDPAHRRRLALAHRGQARLRIPAAHVGERAGADAEVTGADPRLRGRLADQALHPRPLLTRRSRRSSSRARPGSAKRATSCAC